MSRVIIAGSRDFVEYAYLCESLHSLISAGVSITEVVSGTARGADRLGERWARENLIPISRFPAQWDTLGKSAGYVRNKEMAAYADIAVLFWDGESQGTKHMRDIMLKKGKEVITFLFKGKE